MNRKGIVFTLMAIVLLGLMVAYFSVRIDTLYTKEQYETIESRFKVANSFVKTLERHYIPSIFKMSARAATKELVDYAIENKEFYADHAELRMQYESLMTNGSIKSQGSTDIIRPEMDGLKVNQLFAQIVDLIEDTIHISASFELTSLNIYQDEESGPWGVTINATYNSGIRAGIANWTRINRHITTIFSIEGIKDPYFAVAVQNRNMAPVPANRTINRSSYHTYHDTTEDTQALINDIKMGRFRFSSNAPSFFDRLLGASGAPGSVGYPSFNDCCGIESYINPSSTGVFPAFAKDNSYVDYCYFTPKDAMPSGVEPHEFINNCGKATGTFGRIWKLADVTNEQGISGEFKLDERTMGNMFVNPDDFETTYYCEPCGPACTDNQWKCAISII